MFNRCKTCLVALASMSLLALPGFGATSPVPGTLNYIEGQVYVNGQKVTSPGAVRVDQDQTIETSTGKAELLLTPGVFLRLGDHSSLQMISPSITNTEVRLLHGEAILEAAQMYKENDIRVSLDGSLTMLEKSGLYAFNADQGQVRVFEGKAVVSAQDQQIELKKGHEVFLGGPLKSQKFDRKDAQDPLYAWSNLRSEYEAQASAQAASRIVVGGPGWYGPGWYWSPWWDMWGFVPGAGVLYSPFGWPYYSPGFVTIYRTPFRYYGVPRVYGRGYAARPPAVGVGTRPAPSFRGPAAGRMSGGGFAGGGFHPGVRR